MNDTPTQAALVQEVTTLRHRLQQLEAVITSLPNAMCVMALEGRIAFCNATFAQLTSAEGAVPGCAHRRGSSAGSISGPLRPCRSPIAGPPGTASTGGYWCTSSPI
jgi:PAS domain